MFAKANGRTTISIGRIAYCVVLALPTWMLVRYPFIPAFENHVEAEFYIIPMFFFSLVLTLIGTAKLIYDRNKGKKSLFWPVVTGIASLPLAFYVVSSIFIAA